MSTPTWTLETTPATGSTSGWRAVVWAPALSLFVSGGSLNPHKFMTSPDGSTWTFRDIADVRNIRSLAWSSSLGLFVALSGSLSNQCVFTSPDGVNWTLRPATPYGAAHAMFGVAWSPTAAVFVAVGAGAQIMSSTDGVTWTARTSPDLTAQYTAVCWAPQAGVFVAVANLGDIRIATSTDGVSWTGRMGFQVAFERPWTAVVEGAIGASGTLVALCGRDGNPNEAMLSSDGGVTWAIQTTPSLVSGQGWQGITWGNTPSGSLFVAVGASNDATADAMTSPDGVTWTLNTMPADNFWTAVTWVDSLSTFVAVSSGPSTNEAAGPPMAFGMTYTMSLVFSSVAPDFGAPTDPVTATLNMGSGFGDLATVAAFDWYYDAPGGTASPSPSPSVAGGVVGGPASGMAGGPPANPAGSAAPGGCITLGEVIALVSARLDDPRNVHWTVAELTRYVIEALRTYNALTAYVRTEGIFTTTADTPFYDLPTLLPTIRGYHVTDRELVTDCEYALLEPPTPTVWTGTAQFTLDDVVGALQRRRDQFLRETGALVTRVVRDETASSSGRYGLPQVITTIRRAAWVMADGTVWPLKREDEWALTRYSRSWNQRASNPSQQWPTGYSVGVTPPLVVQVAPPPAADGSLDLLTVILGAPLQPTLPILIGVPDDWSWVVKWGALSDLLMIDGVSFDPQRAAYCEARYRQGATLATQATVVLNAAIDGQVVQTYTVSEADLYRRTWQTLPAVRVAPTIAMLAGQNLVALTPVPPSQASTITLELVQNIPVPTSLLDCLEIDGAVLDAFMDYVQHLALFKEGPGQLDTSMSLFDNFQRTCGVTVALDRASVPNRTALFDQQRDDTRFLPREVPES